MNSLFTMMFLSFLCLMTACSDSDGDDIGEVSVTSVSVSPATLIMETGTTAQLTATVLPEDATNATVTWTSSDEAVATVSSDGTVTAVAYGDAVITATAGGKYATCAVTVTLIVPVESIEITPATLAMTTIGETAQLTATVLPEDATNATVTWSSSDEAVATVSADGIVTAVGDGSTVITAEADGVSATCEVTVEIKTIEIEGTNATIYLTGSTNEKIAQIIADAVADGVTSFTVNGDYSVLALDTANPFEGLNITTLDLSGVTGWPTVSDELSGVPSKAFRNYTGIQEVILPEEVKIIGSNGFYGCTALTLIDAPGVEVVESSTFYNCSSLETVNLPLVQQVGSSAFFRNYALQKVDFPQVTYLGGMAFWECTALTEINMPELVQLGEATYESASGTRTGTNVFYKCAMTSISLPKATVIGDEAFYYCTALTEVDLPEATSLGLEAFYKCTGLTELYLPKVTKVADYALDYCSSLVKLELTAEDDISVYGNRAFGLNLTQNIDLILNANKEDDVTYSEYWGTKWKNYQWKSISFVETE